MAVTAVAAVRAARSGIMACGILLDNGKASRPDTGAQTGPEAAAEGGPEMTGEQSGNAPDASGEHGTYEVHEADGASRRGPGARSPYPDEIPLVAKVARALESLGATDPRTGVRATGGSGWTAEWSGELGGSDVWIAFEGAGPDAPGVRLFLDHWTFEYIPAADLPELLLAAFSGRAAITVERRLFFRRVDVLTVTVDGRTYSTAEGHDPERRWSPWENDLRTA
ncbi:hypothetical protein [Streptomyces qinzhouensis]|uniref:Uncharacterized protein n=1 Tax=Streptomyces qinzhouensis TaxID=2599401 RepID=A0A5B8JET7_9ACTN|nr:hypothetical protein [Streptomyces qinzhouensis]QDY80127.1 hypothetical protein FQU76_30545 [Streptomyces qinzhouensis]